MTTIGESVRLLIAPVCVVLTQILDCLLLV